MRVAGGERAIEKGVAAQHQPRDVDSCCGANTELPCSDSSRGALRVWGVGWGGVGVGGVGVGVGGGAAVCE